MNVQDCYRILQVLPGSGLDEIKAAFRKQAFRLHPDLNPSPLAAAQFREVNEAFVLLAQVLKGEAGLGPNAGGKNKAGAGQSAAQTKAQKAKAEKAYSQQRAAGPTQTSGAKTSEANFHFKEEDVLRDLLSDAFARQVFEDIYSQLKQGKSPTTAQGGNANGKPAPNPFHHAGAAQAVPLKRRRLNIQWGDKSLDLDMSKGFFGGIKGWMRGQLDHEHTVHFPVRALGPGRMLRLTISSRFGEPKTVEITLPPDFIVGRPIRLKGLGRKLGPFTGDLILRVLAR